MRARSALPSLVTICSLFCGFLSIFYSVNGKLVPAAWLIVIAGFMDAFDGKLARFFDTPSNFGVQFDSIVDICSFGVSPAVLMLHYYANLGTVLWIPFSACFLFLLCGSLRLARFNMELKGFEKGNFTGLPIPSAAGALAAYVVFTQGVWSSEHELRVAISLCAMLSFLMISTFEYAVFPRLSLETTQDRLKLFVLLSVIVIMVFYTDEFFFPLAFGYALSGVVRWLFYLVTDREVADIRNEL